MHSRLIHIISMEKLLLAAHLPILIANIERLRDELLAVALTAVGDGVGLGS